MHEDYSPGRSAPEVPGEEIAMKLQPLGDRYVIRPLSLDDVSFFADGDRVVPRYRVGRVVASASVGLRPDCKAGDMVVFEAGRSLEMMYMGHVCYIVDEHDILTRILP